MGSGNLKLTAAEIGSPLWAKIEEHLNERLAKHRARNDNDLTPDETARLRGRIAEVKYLLELAKPAPAVEADAGL